MNATDLSLQESGHKAGMRCLFKSPVPRLWLQNFTSTMHGDRVHATQGKDLDWPKAENYVQHFQNVIQTPGLHFLNVIHIPRKLPVMRS